MFKAPGVKKKRGEKIECSEIKCLISVDMRGAELTGHLRKPKLQGSGDPFRTRIQAFSGSLNHQHENLMLLTMQVPGPRAGPAE